MIGKKDKFSFSLKDTLPDPWKNIKDKYPDGSVHRGRVSRLAKFGAFVTLEPGIDGLIHISEIGKGKRINHPREVIEENQELDVIIQKADERGRKLSLQLVSVERNEDATDYEKHMAKIKADSAGSFGTLGDLLKAKLEGKK